MVQSPMAQRPSSSSSASPPPPPLLSGSLPALVKAKSDGSLAQSDWEEGLPGGGPLVKLRSRSLEPLTGLAMWSSEPHVVELLKGDRGLGFSILDYQARPLAVNGHASMAACGSEGGESEWKFLILVAE
ncbi:hypothetical protein HPB51_007855 [Rhipicephalus microplus]|uniref:PDZ domain-containing protein n=1 Tax=Rhipicephalus microplus TaxID=6941 RepID=A0A9J6EN87_RHIMP|nr:hypothetical protein HPB51_007855 [Rhipicephalus microplus]